MEAIFATLFVFCINFAPIFGFSLYPLCGRSRKYTPTLNASPISCDSADNACFETSNMPWLLQLEESTKKVEEEEPRIESIMNSLLDLVNHVIQISLNPFQKLYDDFLDYDSTEQHETGSFYLFVLFVLAIYLVIFFIFTKKLSQNYWRKLRKNYHDKVKKVLAAPNQTAKKR